jgi:RNA polymerase sigma-70 factor (family 1)
LEKVLYGIYVRILIFSAFIYLIVAKLMKTPNRSDEKLMMEFRAGNTGAFAKVYKLFYNQLCYFAYKLTSDEGEGQDIVAETFAKLWKIHANFDTLTNIKAFLYITVRNNCLNYLKFSNRRQTALRDFHAVSENQEQFTLNLMVKTELFAAIYREIEMLPPKRKEVFKLFYLENLKVDEIARKLKMKPSTVSTAKYKALDQLRNMLMDKKLLPVAILYTLYK